jgi:photosystem II stability/assembly factor-like uncharacterized protein
MRSTIITAILLAILHTPATAQWESLNGPYGGMLQAIGAAQGGRLLAAMYDGPMYASYNAGGSWDIVADESWTGSVHLIRRAPDGTVYALSQRGIYRTTDGETWENTSYDDMPRSIAFAANGDVLIGGRGLIHRSSDRGQSWSSVTPVPGSARSVHIAVTADGDWLAGAYREGLLRSTDEGGSWEVVGATLPNNEVYSISVIDGTTAFAGLNSTTAISIDAGITWELVSGLTGVNVYAVHQIVDEWLAAESSGGLYVSSDGGRNWAHTAEQDIRRRFLSLHVATASTLFAAADGRLKRSRDGGASWTLSDAGIQAGPVTAFCFPENDEYLAGTWYAGIHRSTNAGASWSLTDSVFIPFSIKEIRATASSGVFALTYDYGLLRMSVDAAHWLPLARVTDSTAIVAFTPAGGALLAGDNLGGLFRSTDGGANWEGYSALQVPSGKVNIAAMREDNVDDMTVYAATDRGFYRSSDGGKSWSRELVDGIHRPLQALHQAADGTLYCAGLVYLYRSTDGGTTWTAVYSGSVPWNAHITSNSRSQVQVSDGLGVLFSDDGTGAWTRVHFPHMVTAMAVDRSGFLLLGTAHAGVFRSTASTLSAGGSAPLPAALSIDAVYPQPLRAHRDISARISLAEAAAVTLRVYDVTGALRLEERRGTLPPGTQVVTLASPDLAPGSYLLELRTPRGRSTRGFVVLR